MNGQTISDILNSIVIGNNVYDSIVIVVVNIGHITYGDNSPIEGDLDTSLNTGTIEGDNNNNVQSI